MESLSGELMHTPTPWFIRVVDEHELIITDEIGNTTLASFDRKYEESERANAEFTVKACNNHYQLLEALKALVYDVENIDTPTPSKGGMTLAKQAIAKAEGKHD